MYYVIIKQNVQKTRLERCSIISNISIREV